MTKRLILLAQVTLATSVAAGCLWAGLALIRAGVGTSHPSSYPSDDLAFDRAKYGACALGSAMLAGLGFFRAPRFWARYWSWAALAASALLLVFVGTIRLDWYAGEPSCCFLDDDGFALVLVFAPSAFGLATIAAAVLIGSRKSWSRAAWRASLVVAVVLAGGAAARFATTAAIPTFDSADATVRSDCQQNEAGILVRSGCTDALSAPHAAGSTP